MATDTESGVVHPLATLEADASTVALLNKSEIDQQIATAHRFPRSIKGFRDEVLALATLNESAAEECSYALPRDGKTIIGPSARFAEVVASAWRNCRAGARVIDDRGEYVVAQGAFLDLEKNVAITYEVQRRIVDKNGRRYKPDMVGVTANAACSIALRNAILKGVPKAMWSDLWEQSRKVAIGDVTTLANKRARVFEKLAPYGVTPAMILAKLGRAALEDVTLADVEVLIGLGTAIKEGDTTPEEAFAPEAAAAPPAAVSSLKERLRGKGAAGTTQNDGAPTYAFIDDKLQAAITGADFALVEDLIRSHKPEDQRDELQAKFDARQKELAAKAAKA